MPYKIWAVGEEALAADWNTYLQQQVVATFPSVAARDAAIAAPTEGQLCYVTATKRNYQWNGAAWVTPYGQPLGLVAQGPAANSPAAGSILPLNAVLEGPAAWLAANTITLPAGAGGLYLLQLHLAYRSDAVVGISFDIRNAAGVTYDFYMSQSHYPSTATVQVHGVWMKTFAAGDSFKVYTLGNPPAAPGFVQIKRFGLVRLGDGFAAGVSLLPGPEPPNEPAQQPAT